MAECDWCGHEHPRSALCAKRPTWSRRGFLMLAGAAAVGAAAHPMSLLTPHAAVEGQVSCLVSYELLRDATEDISAIIRAHILQAAADFERRLIYGDPFSPRPTGLLS